MSGECELCHEHTLECKCEKDIPMSDNMRKFFERLIDLKLFIKKRIEENNNFYKSDDEVVDAYGKLLFDMEFAYKELDELIRIEK